MSARIGDIRTSCFGACISWKAHQLPEVANLDLASLTSTGWIAVEMRW